ncbi:MAG: helix-turn-helix domain-containing protein [Candidatus Thiodiazotropha taylori]|nr:helix-turn-helix domain-containing protein [Candidatus Thiodiazotropha taylori]
MTTQHHSECSCLPRTIRNQSQTPKIDTYVIGQILKNKRKAKGLTQEQASDLLHLSVRTVRYHEYWGIRDIVVLDRICRFYGIELIDMIREAQS